MADRSRNPRGEGARLREEILVAAISLLDESTDPGVLTLRGIARRAGISAPPIYQHFADLPELVDAVRERSFDDLLRAVTEAIQGTGIEVMASQGPPGDPARALVAAGAAYVRFGQEHPARYRLMFSADGYATNAVATLDLVTELIAEAARVGAGTSVDAASDAWMLWAGLHGVSTLEKPGRQRMLRLGKLDRPALLATMVRRLARLDEPTGSG